MKKSKVSLTTAQIVVEALRRRGDKWRLLTPHDIWKKILVKAEITDALNLGVAMPEVQRVLSDDSFWRFKFLYDFPDLVEFVGSDLPAWIVPGDPESLPEFRDLPWRRYYYVCRRYMRKVAKAVVILGTTVQNLAARYSWMAYYPTAIRAEMVPGSTFMVAVRLYHRPGVLSPETIQDYYGNADNAKLTLAHFSPAKDPRAEAVIPSEGSQIGNGDTLMTIWEFCSRFLVADPEESNAEISGQIGRLSPAALFAARTDARWFRRNLEMDTNIVQIALVLVAQLGVVSGRTYVDAFLRFRDDKDEGLAPFYAWVASVVPTDIGDVWMHNVNPRRHGLVREQFFQLVRPIKRTLQIIFVADAALHPRKWISVLTYRGQKLFRARTKDRRFLIGEEEKTTLGEEGTCRLGGQP